jgi:hypothetical protein
MIGPLTISAVYLPPKHIIKQEQLTGFFSTLGPRFLAGGDYNMNDWVQTFLQRPYSDCIH